MMHDLLTSPLCNKCAVEIDLVISQGEMVGQVEVGVILRVKAPSMAVVGFCCKLKSLGGSFFSFSSLKKCSCRSFISGT